MPFHPDARRAIGVRDKWTCQNPNCLGIRENGKPRAYRDDWMLHAAHWPEMHQREEDHDLEHGRMLCVACHIVEEWNRGNHRGARLLYRKFTFRTHSWVAAHGTDEKTEFDLLILEEVFTPHPE